MSERKLWERIDAAKQLSISPRVLDRLIADGQIESVKIGRRRLVPDECLDAYVKRLRAAS